VRRLDCRPVARYLLAGADVVMTTSALLRHGPAYVTELLDGLVPGVSAMRAANAGAYVP
jgi:dihydroorotate dehydrogenase (fumarate)